MNKKLLCVILLSAIGLAAPAQVTRLSNNSSYEWGFALTNTKILLRSATDSIWAYDIPGNSFAKLSADVTVAGDFAYGVLNGKLYFAGKTTAEGIELWVTDGTPGGTSMVKNINPGPANSAPKYGFVVFNANIYFTADDGTAGRELWKSDGTDPGTVRVKDINTGAADAFTTFLIPDFKVINSLLVFSAATANDGDELWSTDGTETGTIELKDINAFPTLGSNINSFTQIGTDLVFLASDFDNGEAIWKTDGTITGTVLVKDINPDNSPFTVLPPFFNFQNELYFGADDGTTGFELWKTDGTETGTVLVKDIYTGDDGGGLPNNGFPQLSFAVKNSNKFFFSAMTAAEGSELWESDGTESGTQLLKDIAAGSGSSDAIILPNYFTNGLFQGNKFFLIANTPGVEGKEFYVSDGTAGGTTILKNINPGAADGWDGSNLSYFYTANKFYFVANNGINGSELWQSDGTGPATTLLYDININPVSADGDIGFATIASNIIYFFGTDGDDATHTDFFKIDGSTGGPLPLRWLSIEARAYNNDVLLVWKTALEDQTDHFVIQRSADGINYQDVGQENAKGGVTNNYAFTDAGAMLQPGIKKWYYRIKDIDKDGKSYLSKVVAIALNQAITQVGIRPNPVNSELKLVIDAAGNDHAVIRVINMDAKIVLQRSIDIHPGDNTVTTNVGWLPNGLYLLQVTTSGSSITERFLIQR